MAPKKPKQEKSAVPNKGKAPDKEIKVKKQTRAGKETSTKKKATTARKVKSQVKPVEKKVASTTQKEVQPETKRATDKGPMLLGAGLLVMGLLLLAGRFLHIPFGHLQRALKGAVEFVQHGYPVTLTRGNLVQILFHAGCEWEVYNVCEVLHQ